MWTFVNLCVLLFDLRIAVTAAKESMAGFPCPFAWFLSVYPRTVEVVHDVVLFPNVLVASAAYYEPFLNTCTGIAIGVSCLSPCLLATSIILILIHYSFLVLLGL